MKLKNPQKNNTQKEFEIFDIRNLSEEEYNYWYSLMDSEKKERVSALRFERDRRLTVAGEMLARKMISDRLCIEPQSIIFKKEAGGKPYAAGLAIHFNISHSLDFAVCVVSDRPIGIDIERKREYKTSIAEKICSKEELSLIEKASDKAEEFTRIWTAKEAYLKHLGLGIGATDFKQIPTRNAKQYKIGDYLISIVSEK